MAAVHEKRIRAANAEMIAVHKILDFFGTGTAEAELEEATEVRSDWGSELPVPPHRG